MAGSVYDDEPMQCRCGDCNALFNVGAPGGLSLKHALSAISAIECPACDSVNVLLGQTRTWPEDRAMMRCALTSPLDVRAADWRRTGEYGLAAVAIHHFMTTGKTDRKDIPTDIGELRRCLLLLRRIPEWSDRMDEMKAVSKQWRQYAYAWPELVRLFTKETGSDWLIAKTPLTMDLIHELAVPPKKSLWGF